jgi:hypothetical protein
LLNILKEVMEEKLTATNIEMASVLEGGKYQVYDKAKLEVIIERLRA